MSLFSKNKTVLLDGEKRTNLIPLNKVTVVSFTEKAGEVHFDNGTKIDFSFDDKNKAIDWWQKLLESGA